ncbi:nitronate monooxygenase [Tuanshanicoccus lijuaniae]|uniref:nitronate monooxygenase n=1 Tax=Aerococcaceae bacterium zg-1292 TaxID=2774330 RepID=UPI0019364D02|nr:nitronate monooxygenase [Aerococcaceae bacterium zg-1292]QQA36303.1 nitronate monooxygenase [Aerococcaceae bacterium zg-1292]
MNRITELLGIKYPIFQGAMAQISRHQLVSAVSNAGGLGILASGGLTADEVRDEIRKTKALTDKPFAVNLMLMMENVAEIVEVLIEEGVKVVTTGAGTPKPYMPRLKDAGIIVIPVIPSVKLALKMQELGCDAVVAEGMEAGGHIGEMTTMPLTRQVAANVDIPVVCAGGIADGYGFVAAMALGAEGVQMGTVFLAAEECPIADAYKQAILDSIDTSTVVTGRKLGAPVRCLRNQLTDKYLALENQDISRHELEEMTMGALSKAVKDGDIDNGSLMAGQIAGHVSSIRPTKVIIAEIMTEARSVFDKLTNI